MFINAQALHPYRLAQRCMIGTVDTRQHNMSVPYVPFVERSKTSRMQSWLGWRACSSTCSKPNQKWWIKTWSFCAFLRTHFLSTLLPCTLSNIHHLPLHKSLFIPPSTFLSSVVSLISFCWLLLPSFFFVLYRFCTCQIRRCRHTHRPTWRRSSMTWR